MALTSIPKAGGDVAGPIIGAAIGGVASLVGGKKGSDSAKDAANIQAKLAREAMAEQKRVYELESARDEQRYQTERKDKDYDRAKTLADEQRVIGSRRGAFGGFGSDLSQFSKGYAPAYGMSAEQTQGLMDARNAGLSGGGGMAPQAPDAGVGPGAMDPMSPSMPGNRMDLPPQLPGPSGGAFGSSVWLQAPTGEVEEVSIQDAPQIQEMLRAGAILIPAPQEGRHGMV